MEEHELEARTHCTHRETETLPRLALDWLWAVIDAERSGARVPMLPRPARTESRSGEAEGTHCNRIAGIAPLPPRLAGGDPFDLAARYARGEVEHALWYREWHRQWRRYQLPDRLQRFQAELDGARSPGDVYSVLTQHAVQIVGGYTCLLFPPQDAGPLRPLPNPALRVDAGRITLSIPLAGAGLIGRESVLGEQDGPLASLAPLFSEERAVSLAHAPFGEGGVILLLERRHERVFDAEDWDLLGLLSMQAAAALLRVRLGLQVTELHHTHPSTALPDEAQLTSILRHAQEIVGRGDPLTLVGIRLHGMQQVAAEDGVAAAVRVRRTAAEVLRELVGVLGIAVHRADDEFLLLLPRMSGARAEHLAVRLSRQLPGRAGVRIRLSTPRIGAAPAELLLQLDRAAEQLVDAPLEPALG